MGLLATYSKYSTYVDEHGRYRVIWQWEDGNIEFHKFEAWMDEAVASGMIIAPGYFDDLQIRQAYLGTEWTGDGMGQLNPLDEINAAKERVALGVSNRSIEASEIGGRDWATVHAQLAREEDARLSAGLTPALYSTQGGQPTAPTGKKPTSQVDSTDDQEDNAP
jgi:capsid protein